MSSKQRNFRDTERARSAYFYFPDAGGFDWRQVMSDPRIELVIFNDERKAEALCERGVPAIAAIGFTRSQLTELLRQRGAKVSTSESSEH